MLRRSRAVRKTTVRALVEARDLVKLLAFAQNEPDTAAQVLALAFDRDDRVRWRAIEALGLLAAATAEHDLDKVRNLIRRVLWLMNDESGGLAWHGPEVIAEVLANVPVLIDEYGRIVASFTRASPFEAGAHWAIARLASIRPETFTALTDELARSSESPDPMIRGYGLLALAVLRPRLARRSATSLLSDRGVVVCLDRKRGEPVRTSVAGLAQRVLDSAAAAA